jgi:hypothetical protein
MTLFPDPPSAPVRPELEQTALEGRLGGPSYAYRGAVIDCQKGGHVCTLRMPDHSLDDTAFGCVSTIMPLVDLWVEEQRLLKYMRAVPVAERKRLRWPQGRWVVTTTHWAPQLGGKATASVGQR